MDRNEKMEKLKAKILKAVEKAETFADENDLSFSLEIAYGMGGWYRSGAWESSTSSCY